MAKSVKVRDLSPRSPSAMAYHVLSRFPEFFNLLMNSVKITENGGDMDFVKETFAKKALFERGVVGFDKITDRFYFVYGQQIDEYGNPKTLVFTAANGKTLTRPAYYSPSPDGAYSIKAFPTQLSLAEMIREATDFMQNCDVAIRQNIEACKTPYIVVCQNENLRLSFQQAIQQKILGQAAIVVSTELADGLKSISVSTEYLSDKFAEIRDKERDTLLNKLGILTANINKKERVQSAEVNSTLGVASDYIYSLIDTFNAQCKSYELPFEMKFNGSMEEIYIGKDEESNDQQRNDFVEL